MGPILSDHIAAEPPSEADVLHDLAVAAQLLQYRKKLQSVVEDEAQSMAHADDSQLRCSLTRKWARVL